MFRCLSTVHIENECFNVFKQALFLIPVVLYLFISIIVKNMQNYFKKNQFEKVENTKRYYFGKYFEQISPIVSLKISTQH